MTQSQTVFIVTTNDLDIREVYARAFSTYEAAKAFALEEVASFDTVDPDYINRSTPGIWNDYDYEVFQIEIHEIIMD